MFRLTEPKKPRSLFKVAGFLVLTPILAVLLAIVLFLAGAVIGAIIPRDAGSRALAAAGAKTVAGETAPVTIHLLGNLLHADIVIALEDLRPEFIDKLVTTAIPFGNPDMKNLGFGWGSEAFYTTAGSYSDIKLAAAWKAITGDTSVLRISALPDVSSSDDKITIELSPDRFAALLEAIREAMSGPKDAPPMHIPSYSIAYGDAFFAASDSFNIFYPCNQWVGDVLARAGLRIGRWTPTTFSLRLSLWWNSAFNSEPRAQALAHTRQS